MRYALASLLFPINDGYERLRTASKCRAAAHIVVEFYCMVLVHTAVYLVCVEERVTNKNNPRKISENYSPLAFRAPVHVHTVTHCVREKIGGGFWYKQYHTD